MADLIDLGKERGVVLIDRWEDVRFLTPFAVEFRYDFYEGDEEDEDPVDFESVCTLLAELRKWVDTIMQGI